MAVCTKAPPGWFCKLKSGHDGPCAAEPIPDYTDAEAEEVLAMEAVVVLTMGQWVQITGTLDTMVESYPGMFDNLEAISDEVKRQVLEDPSDLEE